MSKISGLGYGHGRGMGQWGAYGYASIYGWSYQQILAHYYGGTTLGTLPSPEPDITVHLLELDGHNTIASSADGAQLVAAWTGATPVAAPAFEVTSSGGTQSVYSGPELRRPVAARRHHFGARDDSRCATRDEPATSRRDRQFRAASLPPGPRPTGVPGRFCRPDERPDPERAAPGGLLGRGRASGVTTHLGGFWWRGGPRGPGGGSS